MLDLRQKIDYVAIYRDQSDEIVIELVQAKSSFPDVNDRERIHKHHQDAIAHFSKPDAFFESVDDVLPAVKAFLSDIVQTQKGRETFFENIAKDEVGAYYNEIAFGSCPKKYRDMIANIKDDSSEKNRIS